MDPKKPQSGTPEPLSAQAEQTQHTRAKLVSEASRLLETKGYQALSLRSAAKAAGLSPAAPYRHFEHGAPEMLAVIAESGFQDLIAELQRTTQSSKSSGREKIIDVALTYIQFGVERPDLYRALFSSQLAEPLEFREKLWETGEISYSSRKAYESLAAVKQRTFDALIAPLQDAQRDGALKKGDVKEFGLALAALVHGLVGEFIDEGLGGRLSQKQPWSKVRRDMARRMIELLLSGLER